jgi:hypothetical protein
MPANDQYWRDLPTMHKVFAGSAFALFAATLLMMARDEKREWRDYQRQAEKLKVAKIAGQLEGVDTAELRSQIDAIEKKITEIFSGETEQKAREAEAQVKLLKGDLDRLATESKFKNAERDVARANFDIAVRDAIPDAEFAKVRAAYNSEQLQAEAKVKIVEGARAKFEAAKAELVGITAARDAEKAELDKLTAARKALVEQIELLQPSTKWIAAKRSFKEWPIINGFNPHLKIQYDWPKGLKQQLGMANVDRVDRCRSCHVNINDFARGKRCCLPSRRRTRRNLPSAVLGSPESRSVPHSHQPASDRQVRLHDLPRRRRLGHLVPERRACSNAIRLRPPSGKRSITGTRTTSGNCRCSRSISGRSDPVSAATTT